MSNSAMIDRGNVEEVARYHEPGLSTATPAKSATDAEEKSTFVTTSANDDFVSKPPANTNHPQSSTQTLPLNQVNMFPFMGMPFSLPFPVATDLGMYSLWAHYINAWNWHARNANVTPLSHNKNPVVTEAQTTATVSSGTSRHEEKSLSNESSLNSNCSATESLFAASECHLAVLGDEDGDTPLHIAVVQENTRLVEKLINLITFSRLGVNTTNKLIQTPLHLAVLTDQSTIVEKLVNAGGNVNAQDRYGRTPVHLAVEKGYVDCLAKLLECSNRKNTRTKQANLEIRTFQGFTPLHIAVQKNNKSVIQRLIKYDANVNSADGRSGNTPLHLAVDYEYCDVMLLLVSRGAKINKSNHSGITPLQSANMSRNEDVSKVFVSQDTAASKTKSTTVLVTSSKNENTKSKHMEIKRANGSLKRTNDFSSVSKKRIRT